jgi:hypothetical protein
MHIRASLKSLQNLLIGGFSQCWAANQDSHGTGNSSAKIKFRR